MQVEHEGDPCCSLNEMVIAYKISQVHIIYNFHFKDQILTSKRENMRIVGLHVGLCLACCSLNKMVSR